jgi:hypothetical protein
MSELEQEQTQEQDGPEPDETVTPLQPPDEGEQAEAEEAEDVEGQEGEPEPEPEASGAAGAVGEKELERMFKKVDTANASYLKKLEGIMGEEVGVLEPCPRCSDPFLGLIFPPMMRPVDDATRAKVLVSVGEAVAAASNPDPYARRCDTCDGNGVTLSGSRKNAENALTCYDCKGRGWVAVGTERESAALAAAAAATVAGNGPPPEPAPDEDPWHRKPGDPDYGRLPQYVGTH